VRSPLARYYDATTSWPAAILLYQIAYWMPKAKIRRGGHTWIAKPAAEWCAETALTLDQYRRAVHRLRHLRFVATAQHRFQGKVVTHLRLTGKGQALLEPVGTSAQPGWCNAAQPELCTSAQPKDPGHTSKTHEQDEDGVLAHAGLPGEESCNQDSGERRG
jgi:hypothetical protein